MSEKLTRRDLLKAGGAIAAIPALSALPWRRPRTDIARFVFFSDTHIGVKANVAEVGKMLTEMSGKFKPEFAINGGDVTEYGWRVEYANYAALIKQWAVPVHHCPGNHDVRWSPLGMNAFREQLGPEHSTFEANGIRFYMLDSSVPLSHWGHYEKAQLAWLKASLSEVGRETPIILATHHPVGLDGYMVDNETDLYEAIEPYNVKLILNGHGHSDRLWNWDGLTCTMNKGLYQGSYEVIEIDAVARELRMTRRSKEKPEGVLLTTLSLRPNVERRAVWQIPDPHPRKGRAVKLTGQSSMEYRWNKGPWKTGDVETTDRENGYSLLYLRKPGSSQTQALPVRVDDPTSPLKVLWDSALAGGVMSHLLLVNNALFVSTMEGSVYRLDSRTGKIKWHGETGGYCHSSPRLAGDLVLVGSADNYLYAFDRMTGQREWRFKTGGPVYASAAVGKAVAAIASGDGFIYGVDIASGGMKWKYQMPTSNTAFSQSVAASDGTRAYIGAWDSHLYALDLATGDLVWRAPCCGDQSFAYSPAISSPCVSGGRVYVAANGNKLYCFDAETGEEQWVAKSPGDKFGHSSPVVSGGKVLVGCLGDKGQVRCLEASSGDENWSANTGQVIYDSSPVVFDGKVAIGSVNGLLSVLRASDGGKVGTFMMPRGHFLSSPAGENGCVYAATYSNRVIALSVGKKKDAGRPMLRG